MPGAEPFVLLAVEAPVVVGERVEVEVVDQSVEADRHLWRPRRSPRRLTVSSSLKICRARSIRSAVSASVTCLDPYPEVVELEHLHVRAERSSAAA